MKLNIFIFTTRKSTMGSKNNVVNLGVLADKVDLEAISNKLWQVFEVFLVLLGKYNALDTDSLGSDCLLFDAAHGKNVSSEGHFTGHSQVLPDSSLLGQREQRRHNSTACRWTVLWRGALKNKIKFFDI